METIERAWPVLCAEAQAFGKCPQVFFSTVLFRGGSPHKCSTNCAYAALTGHVGALQPAIYRNKLEEMGASGRNRIRSHLYSDNQIFAVVVIVWST